MTTRAPRVLLVGTADTKSAEILYLRAQIEALGGTVAVMDVGVLAAAQFEPEISNRAVAEAAGSTLQRIVASADENEAMSAMARGAARLAAQLYQDGRVDGLLALGGTMGTDLALDVACREPTLAQWKIDPSYEAALVVENRHGRFRGPHRHHVFREHGP